MREFEGGFDMQLAHGRANLEVTAYQKNVSDLLLRRDLFESSGFARQIFNGGKLRTRGIEAALGLQLVDHKDFAWFFRTTFAHNRSKITQLDVPSFQQGGFGASLGTWEFTEDSSATRIVGNDTLTAPLTLPDGTVLPTGSAVVRRIGDSNPDFRMGFGSDFTVKRFGLHFLFDWQKGSNILNLTKLLDDFGGVTPDFAVPLPQPVPFGNDLLTTVGGQRLAGFGVTAGNYVETASFLKLREVTLTYELPNSVVRGILGARRSARLSLSARNLFTVSDYTGLDPEVSNFGNQAIFRNIDVAPFPPSRSFWFSLEVGF